MLRFQNLFSVACIISLAWIIGSPISIKHRQSYTSAEHDPIYQDDYKGNSDEYDIPFEVTDEQKEEARKCFQKYINVNYQDADSLEKVVDKILSQFDTSNPQDGLDKDEIKVIVETIGIDTWFPGEWAKGILEEGDKDGDKKLSRQEGIDLLKAMKVEPPPPPTPQPS